MHTVSAHPELLPVQFWIRVNRGYFHLPRKVTIGQASPKKLRSEIRTEILACSIRCDTVSA